MNLEVKQAAPDDIDLLIEVQNKSFYSDYIKYGECPGYNHSRKRMAGNIADRDVYKILCDGSAIGDIIVRDNGSGEYYLGCICVIPEFQGKGVGTFGMRFLEGQYPNSLRWSLETPLDKEENHRFYKKHGFTITKDYMVGSVKIVLFEKVADKA